MLASVDTPRPMDDFLPRAQIKLLFNTKKLKSTDITEIDRFCQKYIVQKYFVETYLKHLEILDLKKRKRNEKTENAVVMIHHANSDSENDHGQSSDEEDVVIVVVGKEHSDEESE